MQILKTFRVNMKKGIKSRGKWIGLAVLAHGLVACSQPVQVAHVGAVLPPAKIGPSVGILSRAEAPALAIVKPPGNPKINHHFISEKKLAAMPVPKQSPELAKALADLQTGTVEERKARLMTKVIADMVYVRGGSFMRGDFSKLMGIEGVTRMTYNEDDKVVKEITLSDFWISKYKTTYAEFDVFTDSTGRPRTGMEFNAKRRHPLLPSHSYWQEAKDYCQWLGQITGLPIELPTEAQWEYAARSGGQFFMIPTDDGNIEYGRNLPYAAQAKKLSPIGDYGSYPIGLFPANPLGLHDMSKDGEEWVNDWYAADAYSKSGTLDPKGPAMGDRKVVRSWGGDDLKLGVTVWRHSERPIPIWGPEGEFIPGPTSSSPGVRCVVAH